MTDYNFEMSQRFDRSNRSESARPAIRPIVILGPTAGGKSELAVALAQRIGEWRGRAGQVLGADSMQIYRQMDAGTAKPSALERAAAVHHLIDIVEPTERFTVADWVAGADALIESLPGEGVTPIIVGGTNMYLRALLEGLFEGPPLDRALRERLHEVPQPQLHARLESIDPQAALRIHINDRKRTVRAIEVFEQTGRRISELQTQWGADDGPADGGLRDDAQSATGDRPSVAGYRHNPILIGLHWPTEMINPRINARVKAMFFAADGSESLVDETRRLESAGLLGPQARKALGYQQVLDHLAGRLSLDEAFEQTKILTRRFAKSQRTWLKRFRGIYWIDAGSATPGELVESAMRVIAM